MGTRLELHDELLKFLPNVYFQPPSNIQMVYPCIIYNKSRNDTKLANDTTYLRTQGYKLTLIEKTPDSPIADAIDEHFQHVSIDQYYTVNNLNHTTLNLFY